jgi:hypothetical protein
LGQTFDQRLQESSMTRRISFWNSWPLTIRPNSSSRNVGKKPAISTLHTIPKERRSQKCGSCVEVYLVVNTRRRSNIDCSETLMLILNLNFFVLRTRYLDLQYWYCFCRYSSDHWEMKTDVTLFLCDIQRTLLYFEGSRTSKINLNDI